MEELDAAADAAIVPAAEAEEEAPAPQHTAAATEVQARAPFASFSSRIAHGFQAGPWQSSWVILDPRGPTGPSAIHLRSPQVSVWALGALARGALGAIATNKTQDGSGAKCKLLPFALGPYLGISWGPLRREKQNVSA